MMDNKKIISEFNAYVDGFIECCTSDHEVHELLKAVQKVIEDQEERIAIMSEGGFQELFLEVLEKYKDAEVSNIWEHSGCITHDEKELEEEIAEYKRKAGIRVDNSEEGE